MMTKKCKKILIGVFTICISIPLLGGVVLLTYRNMLDAREEKVATKKLNTSNEDVSTVDRVVEKQIIPSEIDTSKKEPNKVSKDHKEKRKLQRKYNCLYHKEYKRRITIVSLHVYKWY